jgi:hypothetical protein
MSEGARAAHFSTNEVGDAGGDAALYDDPVGQDRRDQYRASIEHQLHRFHADVVAMLDGIDAGERRRTSAFVALSVRGDRLVGLVGLLDPGRHLLLGQLRGTGALVGRQHAASGGELDAGGAGFYLAAHGGAHPIGAIGLEADRIAVPAGHADDATGAEHPRPIDLSSLDHPAQLDVDAVAATEVPDRSHPLAEDLAEAPCGAHGGLRAGLVCE